MLSEVSATCDRIIVISGGKIVADAKTDELSSSISGDEKLSLDVEGSVSTVLDTLKVIPNVLKIRKIREVSDTTARYIVEYKKDKDVRRDVFRSLANAGCVILNMQSGNETLEDSFLRLVAEDGEV